MSTLETVLLRRNWGYFTKSCESGARPWLGPPLAENQLSGPLLDIVVRSLACHRAMGETMRDRPADDRDLHIMNRG
jgi:hypothetical protein